MNGLLLAVLGVLVAGFFAGTETGAYALNRIRLRQRVEAGRLDASMLQRVVGDMEHFVCLTLVVQNVAVYAATVGLTALLMEHFDSELTAELVSTITMAPVLLVVAEVLPKSLFHVAPDRLMPWSAPLLYATHCLLWPVARLLVCVVGFWRLLFGGKREVRHAIGTYHLHFFLEEGRAEGVITPQQDIMVRNIMQLGERPVRLAMIALDRVGMVPADASRQDVVLCLRRHDHRRLPIFERERDDVVGILPVLDYLSDEASTVREVMRRPVRLDAKTPIRQALRTLQRECRPMGIVVGESGKAVGVVTIGDLLQQLFASFGRS